MKKTLLPYILSVALLSVVSSLGVVAQNVQLHYDFGRSLYSSEQANRQHVTITLEQFKADEQGSWFYFADFDIRNHGSSGAYTEISREFNLGKQSPFAAHLEFDGGLNLFGSFQNSVLVGPAYNGHNADFSKTWSVQLMYKQFFKGGSNKSLAAFQLTGVWGLNFCGGKFTFSGFADLWSGYIPSWKADGTQKKGLIFMTEPQLWYNIHSKIAVGTEWEISNNFIYPDSPTGKTFYVNPTLAVKFSL